METSDWNKRKYDYVCFPRTTVVKTVQTERTDIRGKNGKKSNYWKDRLKEKTENKR